MSILKQLWTAVKGASTEAGEAIVDSQAIRILEQEMRDAKKHLNQAKENLTSVMAEKMGIERKVKTLRREIEEHEGYAVSALDNGNEGLALEIAEKIAELSNELEVQEELLASYTGNVSNLKKTIKGTERNIASMDRELSVVKTTESVQKASAAAAAKFSGTNSSLRSATDSLSRIKAKQQKRSDQMSAAMELQNEGEGGDLKAKMKAAGIVTGSASSNDILAKLRAKRGG
ncbi:MAG: PspA/IM30 family protein [Gammaproteobacteria bacterium]|nr:PspA/IM30 family protein [Gammaproteobacteria bacterium]